MHSAVWYCCRQRAGPLVKECRALRPRFGPDDTEEDRKAKTEIKKYQRCAVNRKQVDRLELRLALFGRTGTHYTLTFDDEHLPADFKGVRRALQNFFKRSQRWRAGLGKEASIPYIYAIEGLHGDHRYHVHFVCDYNDLCPAEVQHLWADGIVDDEPALLTRRFEDPKTHKIITASDGGYRRLAEYFNKERTDGFFIPIGRHPWSCSRTLNAQLAPPERWKDESGVIDIPDDAIWARRGSVENDFGAYYYGSWIEPDGYN